MLGARSWRGFAVVAGLALGAFQGCAAMRPTLAPEVLQDVVVSYDGSNECKVDPPYTEIYWYASPQPTGKQEVRWVFSIDPRWYGEVNALPMGDHGKTQPKEKFELFKNSKFKAKDGALLVRSGRPKDPKPAKTNDEWPMWRYSVTIWESDNGEKPTTEPKCVKDPGVCIRGGGGTCEPTG